MSKIDICKSKMIFEKEGRPYFMMADACWSAFTNMSLQEFERYLLVRKEQGFNTILLNVLPQWDRGLAKGEVPCPFVKEGSKELYLSDIPEEYFENSCRYMELMNKHEMTPIMVLFWANYTKGTFFDGLWGHTPMCKDDVAAYARKVAKLYKAYHPLYFICGDSNFSDAVVDDYYLPALVALKEEDPDTLVSFHSCAEGFMSVEEIENSIPARLLYNELVDFYCYQSGHLEPWRERSYACAIAFRNLKVRKPVLNVEPCYEGWDWKSVSHGRDHIRQSTWLSILSGADAGMGYGAQGVWLWYREGDYFAPYDEKDMPVLYRCERPFFAWQAMEFEGTKDRVFAKKIVEKYGIYEVVPDSRVEAVTELTRLASCRGGAELLLYMPRSQFTRVNVPAKDLVFDLYDLSKQTQIELPIRMDEEGFVVDYPGVNSDMLLVGYRK